MARVGRMKLGSQGLEVSVQGLGCMGMSSNYGPAKPEPDMIALIHHAVQSGVTFLDTADIYGPHTNEVLLGKVDSLCCLISYFSCFHSIMHIFLLGLANQFSERGKIESFRKKRNCFFIDGGQLYFWFMFFS